MSADRRSVAWQSFALAGASALAQVVTALIYLIVARRVPPADLGRISAAVALGATVAGVADFGTSSLWVRDVLTGRRELAAIPRLGAGKIVVVGSAAALLIGASVADIIPRYFATAGIVALATAWAQWGQMPLRFALRSELIGWAMLVDRLAVAVVYIVMVSVDVWDGVALPTALAAGAVVDQIVCRHLCPEETRVVIRFDRPAWPYRESTHFGIQSLALTAQSLDTVILNWGGGAFATGIYSAVNRWTQPMGLLVGAFTQASVPYVARDQHWPTSWRRMKHAVWMPVGAAAIAGVVAIVSPWVVGFLLGPAYADSGAVLTVICIGLLASILDQPLAAFLQALGHERWVSRVIVVSVVVELGLVALLAAPMGAMGGALSIAVGEGGMAIGLVAIALLAARAKTKVGGNDGTKASHS